MSSTIPFHIEFQTTCLAQIWRNHRTLQSFGPTFQPSFLEDPTSSHLCAIILDYFKQYGKSPSKEVVFELIRKSYPEVNNEKHIAERRMLEKRLDEVSETDISDEKFTQSRIGQFISWRSIIAELKGAVDSVKSGEYDPDLVAKFAKAIKSGEVKVEFGVSGRKDVPDVLRKEVNPENRPRVPTGITHLDQETGGGPRGGELWAFLAPPKGFKCTDGATPHLMHDGSVKIAKDIIVGDLLMGDDSLPRRVLEVGKGRGEMYSVKQSNGDDYKVTAEHVLCLKRPNGPAPTTAYGFARYHGDDVMEMTAEEYAKQTKWFKRTWNGYKVGVEFPSKEVPTDPYYIGLWLGDGLSRGTGICVGDNDHEVSEYLRELADQLDLKIHKESKWRVNKSGKRVRAKYVIHHLSRKGPSNCLTNSLRLLGVGGRKKKHLPSVYKMNSREVRLQVLAGMIDSDGHFMKAKGFIFSNTNYQLCDDACWLARSLGFRAHIVKVKTCCCKPDGTKKYGIAYRTLIQGRISEIPTKLPRKRAKNSPKVTERTAIKVRSIGDGDWYGFRVDGNHRYLLSDFTVTHNSGLMLNIAFGALLKGTEKNVLYLTLELSEELQALRFAIRTTMKEKERLFENPESYIQTYLDRFDIIMGEKNDLMIKYMAPYVCTPRKIREFIDSAKLDLGIEFGLICVDYLDLMGSDSAKEKDYLEKVQICTDLRAVAVDYNIPIITACRATREATGKKRINMSHMAGSFERVAICDYVAALCMTDQERIDGVIRIVPVAVRNESGAKQIICEFKPHLMAIYSVEARELTDEDFEDEDNKSSGSGTKRQNNSGKKQMDNEDDEAVERGRKRLNDMRSRKSPKRSVASELADEDDI